MESKTITSVKKRFSGGFETHLQEIELLGLILSFIYRFVHRQWTSSLWAASVLFGQFVTVRNSNSNKLL